MDCPKNSSIIISPGSLFSLFFILFRYFDIMKPFPVSFFDRNFKNSFGVIMDDICAGFFVVLAVVCFMIIKSKVL